MNRRLRTILAAALTSVVLMMSFASCAKTTEESAGAPVIVADANSMSAIANGGTVSGDTTWYSTVRVELNDPIDPSSYRYIDKSFVGMVNDKLVYSYHCQDPVNNPAETGVQDYIVVYDMQGTVTSCVNIKESLGGSYPGVYLGSVKKAGDSIALIIMSFDEMTSTKTAYQSTFDVETGTIGQLDQVTDHNLERFADYPSEFSYSISGYKLISASVFVDENTIKNYLIIIDNAGNVTMIDLAEKFPTLMMEAEIGIENAVDKGDGKALVKLSMSSGSRYYEVNCADGSIAEATADYTWLENYISDIKSVDGYGSIIINESGIMRVNFETSSIEEIFNYSNSNINRYDAQKLVPVNITDERVVLCGTVSHSDFLSLGEDSVAYVLEKADTNPNQGKSVIRIASLSGSSYALCDAVCRFNDTSSEYFITFDTRYNVNNYTDVNYTGNRQTLNALSAGVSTDLSNQLAIDLVTGDGPDIIIGGSDYSQLNNANCFIDLTSFVQSELTPDSYYTNIFDAYKVNGSIYQLPITFGVAGIVTNSANIAPGQKGFTFDQYASFVSGPCNGTNPIYGGKLSFFITTLNSMEDLMRENGNANYNNEAFRALAQYTSSNVLDPISEADEGNINVESFDNVTAVSMIINNIASYHRNVVNGGKTIVGFPSYDGRGPIIVGNESIGVSAHSSNVDGCMDFLRTVMSSDCQRSFASANGFEGGIPVNRQAFAQVSDEYITSFNSRYNNSGATGSTEAMSMSSVFSGPADDSLKNGFESVVTGLTGNGYTVDAPINAIVREEIPAYFEGQKSLDEVINIINDRVQTVLNERG